MRRDRDGGVPLVEWQSLGILLNALNVVVLTRRPMLNAAN